MSEQGGRFILDSSEIASDGTNQIVAEGGETAISTTARSHQYISFERHDHNWHHNYDHTERDWDSRASAIKSTLGNNVIQSTHDSIDCVSTDITALGRTSMAALGKDVTLRTLILDHEDSKSSSNWWFDSDSSISYDQYARPTRIASIAGVDIYAVNDIRLEGAQVQSLGNVTLIAGHDITVSAPILNHSFETDSLRTSIELPTCPPLSLNSVYQDAKTLWNPSSSQTAATIINSWNLGVDSLNAVNGVLSGLRAGSVANAIFPSASSMMAKINLTDTETETHWQSVDPNAGIACGTFEARAGDTVEFLNGVPVDVQGNASIQAPHLILRGAKLDSESNTTTDSIGLGLSAGGDLVVAAQHSESHTSSTTYANQNFNVGGEFKLDVGTLDMRDANITAHDLTGHVDHLNIVSDCNTSSSDSLSVGGDTAGNIHYQDSHNKSAQIGTVSGITTQDSHLKIEDAHLTGARFLVTGNNETEVKHLETETVHEYNQGDSSGFCGNLQDMTGLGNRSFTQAIPTVGVQHGRNDYRAEQSSTFTGAAPQAGLDNSGSNGEHVTHDSQYNENLKVPLPNSTGLGTLKDNWDYAAEHFLPKTTEPTSLDTAHAQAAPEDQPTSHPKSVLSSTAIHRTLTQASNQQDTDQKDEFVIDQAEKTIQEVDSITHQPLSMTPQKSQNFWGELFQGDSVENDGKPAQSVLSSSSSADRYKLFSQTQGSKADRSEDGLGLGIANSYNPHNLSNETGYQLGKITGGIGEEYQEGGQALMRSGREAWAAPVSDTLAAETGTDQGYQRMIEETKAGEKLESSGAGLKTVSKSLKWGALGFDVDESIEKVREAAPEDRGKTAVIESAGLFGERLGAFACDAGISATGLFDGGLSLLVIPPATVGCGAVGRYIFEHSTEKIINIVEDTNVDHHLTAKLFKC